MSIDPHLETRIIEMETQLKDFFESFGPVKVDLRINGKIEPVVLFAAIAKPQLQSPFTIVE